ncbi:uracil-DNA glycosylase family protein [Pelagibacterium nitratireducens]|uniref:Uracil-DNA glycosylase family protein n=1 Tax=Pelagibacterium nitratireducens TaxID=1046114 RepID=A0ABZ2I0I9_9HYPH
MHLMSEIRACQLCAKELPLGPRPVVQADRTARLLIIGQAPGRKVHESGIPWNDASGDRLRSWLDISPAVFYDPSRIAIVPMGFCYPGVSKSGSGDARPMKRCAPTWHHRLLASLPEIRLTLLVGSHAQRGYLHGGKRSMTETVKAFDRASAVWALPHPSWRVVAWMRKNPWFVSDVLPTLRRAVASTLDD